MKDTNRRESAIEQNRFYLEKFIDRIPYGFFTIPMVIILINTILTIFFIDYLGQSSKDLVTYFGSENIILIILSRVILVSTLSVILYVARHNLREIRFIENDIGSFFISDTDRKEAINWIQNTLLKNRIEWVFFFAIAAQLLYQYNNRPLDINCNFILKIVTYSLWWILILYGSYSGFVAAAVVSALFRDEQKMDITVFHPDRLGGYHKIRKLLQAPALIGFSAIMMSLISMFPALKGNLVHTLVILLYYLLIFSVITIPSIIFSTYLSKKKLDALKNLFIQYIRGEPLRIKFMKDHSVGENTNYKEITIKDLSDYEIMHKLMDRMKTQPFDIAASINYILLIATIVISILASFFIKA